MTMTTVIFVVTAEREIARYTAKGGINNGGECR
jgi:hypothetical protein